MQAQREQQHQELMNHEYLDAYRRIKAVMSYSREPRSPPGFASINELMIKHLFHKLEPQGVTSLPITFGNRAKDKSASKLIAKDFMAAYADKIWQDRSLDPVTEDRLVGAVARLIFLAFQLKLASSQITSNADTLIEESLSSTGGDAAVAIIAGLNIYRQDSTNVYVRDILTATELEFEGEVERDYALFVDANKLFCTS